MEYLIIAAAGSAADRLYLKVFEDKIFRIPPRGPGGPLLEAGLAALGGVAATSAVTRLTGQSSLLTAVVGAFIGGRLVGGVIDSFRSPARQ